MKSILFIMRYYLDNTNDNLSIKFKNQIQAANNIGLDVWYIAFVNNKIFLIHDDEKLELFSYKKKNTNSLSYSIYIYTLLYKSIIKTYNIKNDFDYVYIRDTTPTPTLLKGLKKIRESKAKIIIEIPTYPDVGEYQSEKRLARKLGLRIGNKMNHYRNRYVNLYTLIGDKASNYLGKPALNIENGICLNFVPKRIQEIDNNEIHCLGLASMSRWHGYDRFIQGLFEYKKRGGTKRIVLHLAGNDGDGSLKEWKELSTFYNLENEVIFEGPVYGEKLNELINKCDIGVATLAGYRINLKNSSTLKIREYTARGLPFIYAVEDSVLSNELTFALKVSNDDTPIDIENIINFVNVTRSQTDIVETMRKYAQERMSWEKQFSKVISIFNEFPTY